MKLYNDRPGNDRRYSLLKTMRLLSIAVSSGRSRFEQKMIDQGGGLKLIHVNEYIFEVLDMMGMVDEITIEKD